MASNSNQNDDRRHETGTHKQPFTRRQMLGTSALAAGGIVAGSVLGQNRVLAANPASGTAGPYPGDDAWRKAVTDVVKGRTISVGFTTPAASEFYDIIEHGAYSQMRAYSDWFGVKWNWTTFFPGEHQDINDQVNTIQNWVTSKLNAILVCTAGDFASMQKVYGLRPRRERGFSSTTCRQRCGRKMSQRPYQRSATTTPCNRDISP